MADELKSTRQALGDTLISYMDKYKDNKLIVLTADLTGPTGLLQFSKSYPGNFMDLGIAESNMIGVGAGMALDGMKVVMTSFASFITGRYDQIRCSLAYPKIPCIIVGTHSGMAIGRDGVTQMGLEDIAIMRALPNMRVIQPNNYTNACEIIDYLLKNDLNSPVYLRLHRQPYYDEFGDWDIDGQNITIYFSGCFGREVYNIIQRLNSKGISGVSAEIVRSIKPLLTPIAPTTKMIVTIEDHSIIGGLGSAIIERCSEMEINPKIIRIGLNDIFPESGKPEDLYRKYKLDEDSIYERIIYEFEKLHT